MIRMGREKNPWGSTLSGCGPTAFYTRSVALLNDVREDALCETLDKLRLHSFCGGDIESGVGQVETAPFVNVLQKLCVIDPLSDSWSDEAQVAAQMRMALWGLEGATASREERDEGESLYQVARFSWPDRSRELTLVGERSRKEGAGGWPLQRIVCTISRPADQGGFGLRLAVESPTKETEKLFEECLVSCDGATWPLDSGGDPCAGPFYGIPDYRCEVRLKDGSIAAVVPASMAWRVAYGTWSFVEPKGGEDPHVVLTCGEDVPELTRMALLEATGSSDGIDETLRKHVGWALSKIDVDLRRWRLANEGVDDELERQRRRVSEFLSRGPQQDGVPWGGASFVAYDRGQLSLEKRFEANAREREERYEHRARKRERRDRASVQVQRWHPFVGWGRISEEAARHLQDDLFRIAQVIDRNREYVNICVNDQYDRDRERYDSLKVELGLGGKYMPQVVLLCSTDDAAAQLIMTILTDRAARLWGTSDEDRPKTEPQPEPEIAEPRRVPERLEPVLNWASAVLDSDDPGPDELTVASLLMGGEAFVLQFEDVCASVALERGGESPFLPFPATVTLTNAGACAAFEDELGQVHYVPISGEMGESECKALVAFVNDCCGMSGDGEHIRAVYDENGQAAVPRLTTPRPRSPIRAFPAEPQTSRSQRSHASPREHVRRACWVMQPCGPGRTERRRTLRRATVVMKNGVSRTQRRSMDGSGNLIVPVVMAGR